MNKLIIAATTKTPEINFKSDGNFTIKGNSYSENVAKFYLPIINWLETIKLNDKNFKELNVELNYINTASIKQLLTIISKINLKVNGAANVNWIYEKGDEDMRSNGEDMQ